MAKVKSYMNPNIPKPKPGDSKAEVTKPVEPRKKRPSPLTTRGIKLPRRKPTRPLPPGTLYDYAINKVSVAPSKERQLPRKVTSVISKRKPAPKSKGGR